MDNTEKIQEFLKKKGIDAIYITEPSNVRYVSGYTSDDSTLLITSKNLYFITDPRYVEQASLECPDYKIVNWRVGSRTKADTLADIAAEEGLKTLAFEGSAVTYAEYEQMRQAVRAELVSVGNVVEKFREVKKPEEIACSRIACDIACRAFEMVIKDIRVGVTEKELASRLSHYMVMAGADTKPYGNILISGARTSLLHGIPSAKAVEYGDFVLMDYGCQYKGYLSDITRTVVVGKASAKQREVYALVRKMVELSTERMVAGSSGVEVYEASVEPIRDTEYFPYHYQGIGHSIGLFVHEKPGLGPRDPEKMEANNIITIEPGIYIPGWGGVRIEDQVLVGEGGNEVLTWAERDLIEL